MDVSVLVLLPVDAEVVSSRCVVTTLPVVVVVSERLATVPVLEPVDWVVPFDVADEVPVLLFVPVLLLLPVELEDEFVVVLPWEELLPVLLTVEEPVLVPDACVALLLRPDSFRVNIGKVERSVVIGELL